MRFSIVRSIYKKEFIEMLRDKKNIFMTIILPILLYPILSIGIFQMISMSNSSLVSETTVVSVDRSVDEGFRQYLNSEEPGKNIEIKYDMSDGSALKAEPGYIRKNIEDNRSDVYITKQGKKGNYTVYYNSSDSKGDFVREKLEEIFKGYNEKKASEIIEKAGMNPEKTLNPVDFRIVTVAEKTEEAGSFIGRFLPFLLIMGVLSGAIYPAVDIIAGEKERGTLETLLTLPITNMELITGKYLAVCSLSVLNAMLNMLSMGITFGYISYVLGAASGMESMTLDMGRMWLPFVTAFLAVIVFSMVISVISTCICSLAKSFKEAQNYLTPLTLITMIPAYASLIPTMELNMKTSFIPVVNISLLIKSVFSMKWDIRLMFLVLLVNLLFVVIGIICLSKMFNSEDILFGDGSSISMLELRRNITPKIKPTVSDGILIFIVELIVFLTLGSYIQMRFRTAGLVMSELIMLFIVLLYSWYIKLDMKKAFRFNRIKAKDVFFAVRTWILFYILLILVSSVIARFFLEADEMSKKLAKALMTKNIILTMAVSAVIPAICEEILFRGFIMSAFSPEKDFGERENLKPKERKTEKKSMYAVIFSGILFGVMHLYPFKIIPISILGIGLGYMVKKTDSIYSSMLIHFINNAIAVIVTVSVFG